MARVSHKLLHTIPSAAFRPMPMHITAQASRVACHVMENHEPARRHERRIGLNILLHSLVRMLPINEQEVERLASEQSAPAPRHPRLVRITADHLQPLTRFGKRLPKRRLPSRIAAARIKLRRLYPGIPT